MVERFNRTPLSKLETLEESQKADWKSNVLTMTHTYNAAVRDNIGVLPFFFMFGHHSNFAIYAFLGIAQFTLTIFYCQIRHSNGVGSQVLTALVTTLPLHYIRGLVKNN